MTIKELQTYNKILILGYGKEGQSVERFLKRFVPAAEILTADKKDDENYLLKQKDADLVVRSPGIKIEKVFKKWTTATNIFFGNFPGTLVGVTGTKGKSTTTALIAAMIRQKKKDVRLVGNIGYPMLDELETANTDTIAIVELSSYQLADLYFSPHITLVVNWYPEHSDFHGSFEAYKKAKQNSIYFQTEKDYFIYDSHEKEVAGWTHLTKAQKISYTDEFPFDEGKIPLLGAHNKRNIQGALTVAKLFDVTNEEAQAAVYSFVPLPHRLQNVGTFKEITFYDDAISTTPESTIAALNSLKRVETLLLGGQDRGYDFSILAEVLQEKQIKSLVLFPETGFRIKQALLKLSDYYPEILETSDMKEAVAFAYKNCTQGSLCLLSTASPSYSLWKNFEEKGDLFQRYVKLLGTS
ncbi:MAG: UDP-N-acetylmuramoyl-L-alanine--D-glutamate ligase [Candidatus Roizmanbacteria bacterium]|nr:UDP-N-acetylmuramoyl-L-alanine--D-glutamate ligase [Candidatus Roizmanbacteria bacterium]